MPGTGISVGPMQGGWPGSAERISAHTLVGDRSYEAIVPVGPGRTFTSIGAAVASITDACAEKRYLIAIDPGTYAEQVDLSAPSGKTFIDLAGLDRRTTIIASVSQTSDTLILGGGNAVISNLTIRHTTAAGETQKYAIHGDDGNSATVMSSSVAVVNCTVEALGANAKSAIGLGLRANQRVYLIDSVFSSEKLCGIYAHNWGGQAAPCCLFVINCVGLTGGTVTDTAGFAWDNNGSGQADRVVIKGGRFSGGIADILVTNRSAGASEMWLALDDAVQYTTLTAPPAQRRLGGALMPAIPGVQPGSREVTGAIRTGSLGAQIDPDGSITTRRADRTVYLMSADGLCGSFKRGQWKGASVSLALFFETTYVTRMDGSASGWSVDVNSIRSVEIDSAGKLTVRNALAHAGSTAGFFGATPTARPTVTGSRGGNAALGSLITALAGLGLVTDGTTA